jgi:hypothetical protein
MKFEGLTSVSKTTPQGDLTMLVPWIIAITCLADVAAREGQSFKFHS